MNIQRITFAALLAAAPLLAGPAMAAGKHQVNPPLLPQYRHAAPAHDAAGGARVRTAVHHRARHGWRHSVRYGYRPVRRHSAHSNYGIWSHHHARTHRHWAHSRAWAYRDAGYAPAAYAYGYGYAVPAYRPPAYRPGFLAVLGNVTGALFAPLTHRYPYGDAPCW
jgi:hypothetical protein